MIKHNKNIQALFTSLDINPKEVAKTLSNVFNISIKIKEDHDVLDQAFKHKKYCPLIITADFSKGKEKSICLIGKGVLYDSGGYNIKQDSSDMHQDRFGALTAFLIAKQLHLPVKVFLVVNLINDDSILPGSLINFKTRPVKYIDTDAEGRVGLAACIEESPEYKTLITFATLTGHSVYSIGSNHAEVFSKDNFKLSKIILKKNKVLGVGRYFEDYKNGLEKNKILENYNKSYREAGAAKAYEFLTKFTQKHQSLHHFDIAGIMEKQHRNYTFGLEELIQATKLLKG